MSAANATSRLMIHRSLDAIRSARKSVNGSKTIGFVPTMGALHEGHASLLKEARLQNDVVFCSIFVNPTQFAPTDDLAKYPRQLEQDTALLDELGVDHLFVPTDPSTLYGPHHVTFVDPEGFDDIPEGRARPGHFRGVATIVTKLFNIVQPTRAYFGQKDAAQCCLIHRMVQDLNMPVQVVVMDTIRDAHGLAMSSRNAYLTPDERAGATVLYRALCAARELWRSRCETTTATTMCGAVDLQQAVMLILKEEPLVTEIQYVTVDDRETMRPLETVGKDGAVISLAAKVGSVRLIDNIVLK
jgi:pantoate--beta-alanine ligase